MGVIEELRSDYEFYRAQRKPRWGILTVLDRYFLVCANHRLGCFSRRLRTPVISPLFRFFYGLFNIAINTRCGCSIRGAVIGRRFDVHTSFGIEIGDGVVIGDDCVVNSGVCLANKANGAGEGIPRVGNRVTLGLGCKLLGGITIGDDVIVGANAVVLSDVPANHIAVGIPAQIKPRKAPRTQAGEETVEDPISH